MQANVLYLNILGAIAFNVNNVQFTQLSTNLDAVQVQSLSEFHFSFIYGTFIVMLQLML